MKGTIIRDQLGLGITTAIIIPLYLHDSRREAKRKRHAQELEQQAQEHNSRVEFLKKTGTKATKGFFGTVPESFVPSAR